jgi:Kef-type K+ transport system membrane component KefB
VGCSRRERLITGAGMVARGEVTLAIATSALAAGRLPPAVFSALLAVVLVSSLAGPTLVKAFVPAKQRHARRHASDAPPEGSGRGEDDPGR